jgi:hypothetical protein
MIGLILIKGMLLLATLLFVVQLAFYLWIRTRTERFLGATLRLQDAAQVTVREVQQTLVHDIKMSRVDRRLKGETVAEIRATAMKILYANLGPMGLYEVRRSLGLKHTSSLDRFLVGRMEAALFDIKQSAPAEKREIPSAPGKRFYPETMRILRANHVSEDLDDFCREPTKITGR